MPTHHPMQKIKILLVDDDDSIRTSLNFYFGKKRVALASFPTAEQALDYLTCYEADLIITDYFLPGMNGLEFTRALNRTRPGLMKILITAYGNREVAVEAVKLGIHDFIRKPFNTRTLESAILSLMTRRDEDADSFFLDGCRMELSSTAFVNLEQSHEDLWQKIIPRIG